MISWYSESTSMRSLPSGSKIGLRVLQRLDERIYVRCRRVQVERRPRGGLHAEPLVCRLGAVVPGSHSDPPRVEQLGDVMGMHAVEGEADRSATIDRVLRADDRESVDLLQTPERVGGDLPLVGDDVLHPDTGEVVGRGTEPDGLRDRRGAGLEP